ncbi:hypothetical protein IH824_12995 [candidate division KSB1 bacterium]|nr:hypothetical protein [candidate division KSB1 bacterium]
MKNHTDKKIKLSITQKAYKLKKTKSVCFFHPCVKDSKFGNLVIFFKKKATKAGISCLLIKKHLEEYSRNSAWLLAQ